MHQPSALEKLTPHPHLKSKRRGLYLPLASGSRSSRRLHQFLREVIQLLPSQMQAKSQWMM